MGKKYLSGTAATTLGLLMLAASGAKAQEGPDDEPVDLGTLVLTSDEARAGLFGDRPVQDVPFSITGYTEDLIEQTQARTVQDVVDNDPTLRPNFSRSSFGEGFTIRGFPVFGDDFAVDGLFNLSSSRRSNLEPYERVEIFRGPSALLYGTPPTGNVGGIVNLVPKRATDEPVTDLKFTFESDGNFGPHIDIGRRFGAADEFGLRFNGAFYGGDLAADETELENVLGSLAFDYDSGPLRFTADLLFQRRDTDAPQANYTLNSTNFAVPDAPNGRSNAALPFSFFNNTERRAVFGVEYDLSPNWTLSARYGRVWQDEKAFLIQSNRIFNTAGDTAASAFRFNLERDRETMEVGLQGNFLTGAISHDVTFQASRQKAETRQALAFGFPTGITPPAGNIYNPIIFPQPAFPNLPPRQLAAESTFESIAISDVVGFFDDSLQVTLGLRWQSLKATQFSGGTSLGVDQDLLSPAVAVLYKPTEHLSLYGSYSEGLSPGQIAPFGSANALEFTAPRVTEQIEIGAKWEWQRATASLSAFQISQPFNFIDPTTNIFGTNGEVRNRGIEALFSGEVADNFRLLGGVTLQRGELTRTAGGAFNGNAAIGFPELQVNLYGEYDVAAMPGLTLNGRVIYTSSQFVDQGNTQSIPDWTRVDLGASYAFDVNGVPASVNLDVLNVADSGYWQSATNGTLSLGAPRTVLLSTKFEF